MDRSLDAPQSDPPEASGPSRRIPGTTHALTLLDGGGGLDEWPSGVETLDVDGMGLSAAGAAVLEDPATAAAQLGFGAEELELLDFLSADLDPVPADPVFRERLRDDLWNLVVQNAAARSDES